MAATDTTRQAVFRTAAIKDSARIRAVFAEASYVQDTIASLLGIRHPAETMDVEMLSLRLEEPRPVHVLMRLFILAHPVEERVVREVLSDGVFENLVESGLLKVVGNQVRSVANLAPFGDLLVASDFSFVTGRTALPTDHVLGVGPSSVTLANLIVRPDGGTLFDLGCGSGVQALLAASSASRVLASDVSERALSYAEFNGVLNGFDNIQWRLGSFFEPAGDECFDAIACNPPFVISPSARFIYRDGGMHGDGVSESVARAAGARLKDGGFASMLINWIQTSDDDWAKRPLSWVKDSGCDAWVIRSSDTDPLSYAANWLRQTESRDQGVYRARLLEWLAYLNDAGIKRIASGALVLRKRKSPSNWQRADVMDGTSASGQCGGHIRQIFAAEDFLQAHLSDEALLARPYRVPENLVSEQLFGWSPAGWAMKAATLSLTEGLPFSGRVDGPFLGILFQCTGTRPLDGIVDDFLKVQAGDAARIRAAIANVVRSMVRGALLLPVI